MLLDGLIEQVKTVRAALLEREPYDEDVVDRADALLLRLLELRGE